MANPDGAYNLNGMDHMFLVTGQVVLSSILMGTILIRSECSRLMVPKCPLVITFGNSKSNFIM